MSNEAIEKWSGQQADIEDAALRWQAVNPTACDEVDIEALVQGETLAAFEAGAEWMVAEIAKHQLLRRADEYDGDGRELVAELARELRERN